MGNLKKQAVSGVKWSGFQTIIVAISAPLLMLVKARFLTPSEFGTLSIITITIGLFNTIENFGISQAIIQRDEISKIEKSSLNVFNILFVTLLAVILFILSPFISSFFSDQNLEFLLRLVSLYLILNGPSLLYRAFLEKDFYFKELAIIRVLREGILAAATVLLLFLGYGLTGIVVAQLMAIGFSTVLTLYISYRHRVLLFSFAFKIKSLEPFMKFGLFVFGKQLMTFLTHHLDELIIGYLLSNEILGFYYFAKNMLSRLRELLTSSFSKVLFPLLSKVKNDRRKLSAAYNDISRYLAVAAFPIFIGIALTAHQFIPFIFGEEWIESVPYFRIFSIILIPYILTANIATSLLYSIDKPNLVFLTDVVINSLYLILLLVVTSNGVFAILYAYSAYIILKTGTLQFLTSKFLETGFITYLLSFRKVLLVTVLMSAAILLTQWAFDDLINHDLIEFLISVVVGVGVYILSFILIDKKTIVELKSMVMSQLS